MTDPLPPWALRAAVAVVAVVALFSSAAGPSAVQIAVLALGALALVPLLGWLRVVSFTPIAAAGAAAAAAAWLLGAGQAVPVAFAGASAAGASLGGLATAVWPKRPSSGPAWVSVLIAAGVWGLLLPRVTIRAASPPVLFGIDLSNERNLGILAAVLLAAAAGGLANVARSQAGREMAAVGAAPELALRSGSDPAGTRLRAGLLGGLLAGWAGLLLVLDAGAMPAPAQLSPGAGAILLGVAVLGGVASIPGAVIAAVLVGLASVGTVPAAGVAGIAFAAVAVTGGRGIADVGRRSRDGRRPA